MKSIGLYKYSVSYSEHLFKLYGYNYDAGFALNIVFFFPRNFNILRPLLRKDRAAIGCTENGQPIRVSVHSDLGSDELISYMQGVVCCKFGEKKHI